MVYKVKRKRRKGNPVPYSARYRYKKTGRNTRQRLAFLNNEVVEIVGQKKIKGKWKETYRKMM